MDEGRPSFTAIISAMIRAAHLAFDGEPKIFTDPLALALSGAENEAALKASLDNLGVAIAASAGVRRAEEAYRYLRTIMTLRSRFTEDELDQAMQRGIAQYVILGAGLDSFVYRRRDLANMLRVFEVDLPEIQSWKRARLRAVNIPEPENLTFVPLDLEQQPLVGALHAAGLRREDPTFVSWLGTTQYLTADAIFNTLRQVASLAAESEIVFQYQIAEDLLDEDNRQILEVLRAGARASGEPWLSLFDPARLAEQVKALGFVDVTDFGPEQALERYFVGRTDELRPPVLSHFMKARVGRRSAVRAS
jgi:methyltransferase (TIGR00027 family)